MKVAWKKHRSARSLAKAYFGGTDPEDIIMGSVAHGEPEHPATDFVDIVRSRGAWAFVDTKTRTVNYWHDRTASLATLAFILGHEVGHISGSHIKATRKDPDNWAEELRADEYGMAAALVLQRLVKRAGRLPMESKR